MPVCCPRPGSITLKVLEVERVSPKRLCCLAVLVNLPVAFRDPQPTVRLEEHSNCLLAHFDTQLRIIANRYLAFFLERRNIEATYIRSLRSLHHKAKTVDALSFDPGAEPTTTRAAWDKVRDSLEREAKAQQCFVDILDNDVIKPLAALKVSQEDRV
ncbi:hypothetical protein EDB86DRAFT_1913879 [Lactarius hatsudake]|nr:hypothetical protein EDB86DRAFT_1913879 [Lactarius hatsudake]